MALFDFFLSDFGVLSFRQGLKLLLLFHLLTANGEEMKHTEELFRPDAP